MSLERILKNLDLTKIKSSSGLTFSQELVNTANLLRECIQNRINHATVGKCISAADIADIQVNGNSLTVALKIGSDARPSIFNEFNNKYANVFWLLNDGFVVGKHWYFDKFPHKERWVIHEAKKFVEQGIDDFNSRKKLPVKIVTINKPDKYYWEG